MLRFGKLIPHTSHRTRVEKKKHSAEKDVYIEVFIFFEQISSYLPLVFWN